MDKPVSAQPPLAAQGRKGFPVYADYQATTPLDPTVRAAMLPWLGTWFGNPHATAHAYGWAAEEAVEMARAQVAALIGADAREIIFTSGATESNHLAIRGIAHAHQGKGRNRLVTVETEHKCVREAFAMLAEEGWQVTVLPVQPNGLLDMAVLEAALDEDVLLCSIMAVQNEIGVIQPLAAIAQLCAAKGVLLHSDAAQGFGKIPLHVTELGLAAMSLSAHKAYGPQGIGALYLRRRPRVALDPLWRGGGQERGLRSGTVPVMLAVGLGQAAETAGDLMVEEAKRLRGFFDAILAKTAHLPHIKLHGDAQARWPGNINLNIAGVPSGELIKRLKGIAVSAGSACASGSAEPSYVLRAIGVTPDMAQTSIRIGLGRFTTQDDVEAIVQSVLETVR